MEEAKLESFEDFEDEVVEALSKQAATVATVDIETAKKICEKAGSDGRIVELSLGKPSRKVVCTLNAKGSVTELRCQYKCASHRVHAKPLTSKKPVHARA